MEATSICPRHQAAVRRFEAQIIAQEGHWTVNGAYYARSADAGLQRRWEAEKRAREEARRCAWCHRPFLAGEATTIIADEIVHETRCADEYAAFTKPTEEEIRKHFESERLFDEDNEEYPDEL